MTNFERLGLAMPILQALKSKGYHLPTPVQEQAIPLVLDGKDIFGSARTGTGKTAAFALPLLHTLSQQQRISRHARALVLAPTRELAQQIGESFRTYGKNTRLRQTIIYGGVAQQAQVDSLKKGSDILVATPGRLLDLVKQKFLSLHDIRHLVLDEADRMLDMGFIHDIRRILDYLPAERQTLLFSATLSADIKRLAGNLLHNPETVAIDEEWTTDSTSTSEKVYYIDRASKINLLQHLVDEEGINRALVFTRTRRGADKLVKMLSRKGILAQAIHGDKTQSQRLSALKRFKENKLRMLVATDVAARGLDVSDLTHVINYDIPQQKETYTHRIGRTGRAGRDGAAYSFCSPEEKVYIRDIQQFTSRRIPVAIHPYTAKRA